MIQVLPQVIFKYISTKRENCPPDSVSMCSVYLILIGGVTGKTRLMWFRKTEMQYFRLWPYSQNFISNFKIV